MLRVSTPPAFARERAYVIGVVFSEFLELAEPIAIDADGAAGTWRITLPNGKVVTLPDAFFAVPETAWLTQSMLPPLPLRRARIAEPRLTAQLLHGDELPVLYGRPLAGAQQALVTEDCIELGIDVLGSAFFMLTRYEEAVDRELDAHGRSQAARSVAARAGCLEYPIVNEYVELLRGCLDLLCPGIAPQRRRYRVVLTHDVDRTTLNGDLVAFLRGTAGDLLLRHDPSLLPTRVRSLVNAIVGDTAGDPVNRFSLIMGLSEAKGLTSEFNFIPRSLAGALDGTYTLADPFIQRLLVEIHRRGHRIGIHPSYRSFGDADELAAELRLLQEACARLGIHQESWGGRQHYLRWDNATWSRWADLGLSYDSTLGYAEAPGFRCGTCYEFTTYDLARRTKLSLRERPLTVMEGTLVEYRGLPWTKVPDTVGELARVCAHYQGDFVLLWHNSSLPRELERRAYRRSLDQLVAAGAGGPAPPPAADARG